MLKINTFAKNTSIRTLAIFMIVLAVVVGCIYLYNKDAHAAGIVVDTYTDNAGGKQSMNITHPGGKNRAAIIFVHGGGFRVDGATFMQDFQNRAAAKGYASFRIKYRLIPNGLYEQLEDVMRAVSHIRQNAADYGIDPGRIALWGDSAGGSLSVRAGATGRSGAAAVVGWSAPTNAYTTMTRSGASLIDALDHSTCVDTSFTSMVTPLIALFQPEQGAWQNLGAGQMPSPDQAISMANTVFKAAGIVLSELPSAAGRLEQSAGEWGITRESVGSVADALGNAGKKTMSKDDIKSALKSLSVDQTKELVLAAIFVSKSLQDNDQLTPEQGAILGIINEVLEDVVVAQLSNLQDSGKSLSLTGVNAQALPAKQIAECIQNLNDASPALFADPNSPPMFLANAQAESLVPPDNATQMAEKLRSMGVRGEYLILPGETHMGYDARAEEPSFKFLDSILNPSNFSNEPFVLSPLNRDSGPTKNLGTDGKGGGTTEKPEQSNGNGSSDWDINWNPDKPKKPEDNSGSNNQNGQNNNNSSDTNPNNNQNGTSNTDSKEGGSSETDPGDTTKPKEEDKPKEEETVKLPPYAQHVNFICKQYADGSTQRSACLVGAGASTDGIPTAESAKQPRDQAFCNQNYGDDVLNKEACTTGVEAGRSFEADKKKK